MAKESGFDRDFGYLMPFIDRIATATEGLSPEARAELQKLMAGEKEKWQRIRSVLTGSAAPSAPAKAAAAPNPVKTPTGPGPTPTLTVGSLRRGS